MNPGIYPNLSNEEYHNHKESISRSAIMDYLESPYLYWAKHVNPNRPPKESTKAMEFGNAFHSFVLEKHLFFNEYIVEPEKVLLKDVGRHNYDIYKERLAELEKGDRKVISVTEWKLLNSMRDALFCHKEAVQLILGGKVEQSFFWQDKESGLLLKSRPDILHSNMYVDIKTCASASTRAFQRAMAEGGYHIQGAMTQDALWELEQRRIEAVINICIEKDYPHQIGIKVISDRALEIGREKYKSAVVDLSRDIRDNNWKGYEPETVDLPGWYE